MVKPKYDCVIIFKYFDAIHKDLEFFNVLKTVTDSDSGGDAKKLDHLMRHFFDNLANKKMSSLISQIPRNKSDKLCTGCIHKHKYVISRECREWFSPVKNE